MAKITSDYRVPEQGIPDLEHLMEKKALNKERSTFQRGAWRAQYDALSPEEKALFDEKFNRVLVKIAAQFGRSRRFIFEDNDKSTPDIDESK